MEVNYVHQQIGYGIDWGALDHASCAPNYYMYDIVCGCTWVHVCVHVCVHVFVCVCVFCAHYCGLPRSRAH